VITEQKDDTMQWGCVYLEEKEPIRVIQDKQPIRLMQYETNFGPTKKRLLKVAHVTLDSRRKYNIVCPVEYWPVLEIWEMNGPRPIQDRHVLVYRSPESPVAVMESWDTSAVPEPTDDEPVMDNGISNGLEIANTDLETPSDVLHAANTNLENPFQILQDFTNYWRGKIEESMASAGTQYTCTLKAALPIAGTLDVPCQEPYECVCKHTHTSPEMAMEGAAHTVLSLIQRERVAHWAMFVLQPVAHSEAYANFLRQHSPRRVEMHKNFEMHSKSDGGFCCKVRHSETSLCETGEGSTADEAREKAALHTMAIMQCQYPTCFLTVRPSGVDAVEAMNSFVQIHSYWNDEVLTERQQGDYFEWVFRGLVLAQAPNRVAVAEAIVDVMDTICRSRIQARLPISTRFEKVLQRQQEDKKEEPIPDSGEFAPTRDAMRRHMNALKAPAATQPPSSVNMTMTSLPSASTRSPPKQLAATATPFTPASMVSAPSTVVHHTSATMASASPTWEGLLRFVFVLGVWVA
jgi:hypothetical protein